MTATFALAVWPFVSALFFRLASLQAAVVATLIGGFLLLPTSTEFDLPVLPPLNKNTIPALTALLFTAVVLLQRRSQRLVTEEPVLKGWIPRNPVVLICLSFLVFGTFVTVLQNKTPLIYGPVVLPGMRIYDGMSLALEALMLLLPFVLARKVLSSPAGHRVLLIAIVVSATGYSFLALYEVRMSPQLNNMVYGFFPHTWLQHLRAGGWRPLVFLSHGLVLGIFLSVAIVGAAGLARHTKGKQRIIWGLVAVWLLGTLVMSKVLGSLVIAIFLLGVLIFFPRRLQIITAALVAISVLTYPVIRANGLVPVDLIMSLTESVSTNRAQSLAWRFDNEQMLLDKANEKPVFGWGGWGRNRVFSSVTGRDLSTTDGSWIIELGIGGWVRFIGIFGLLGWGIIAQLSRSRASPDPATITISLALAGNLIDLIPNSGITPVTWLLAGALCGRLERGAIREESYEVKSIEPTPQISSYARNHQVAKGLRQKDKPQKDPVRESLPFRRRFEELNK